MSLIHLLTCSRQAANLQSLIDSEGTNLAMMLSEAEVAKLSEIANSETENLSENAQEILSMSVVGFNDEISLDLSNVSTDLPNAFAPFLHNQFYLRLQVL